MIYPLPIDGGLEEFLWRAAGEVTKVLYEMRLVEIAGFISGFGERQIIGVILDQGSKPDNGSVLFWRGADKRSESLFEGVLAEMQRGCEMADADDSLMLTDQLYGIADQGILFFGDQMALQKGFGLYYPFFIGGGFCESFEQWIELFRAEQIIGGNGLIKEFVCRCAGKGGETPFFEDNKEIGRFCRVDEMTD